MATRTLPDVALNACLRNNSPERQTRTQTRAEGMMHDAPLASDQTTHTARLLALLRGRRLLEGALDAQESRDACRWPARLPGRGTTSRCLFRKDSNKLSTQTHHTYKPREALRAKRRSECEPNRFPCWSVCGAGQSPVRPIFSWPPSQPPQPPAGPAELEPGSPPYSRGKKQRVGREKSAHVPIGTGCEQALFGGAGVAATIRRALGGRASPRHKMAEADHVL